MCLLMSLGGIGTVVLGLRFDWLFLRMGLGCLVGIIEAGLPGWNYRLRLSGHAQYLPRHLVPGSLRAVVAGYAPESRQLVLCLPDA